MRRKRPFGVSVLTILLALSAPANGIAIVVERWRLFAPFGHLRIEVSILVGAITLLGLAIAVGLWRLERWAWVGAMLWTGTLLVASLALYHAGDHPYLLMLVGIVIVFYLNSRDVQQAFTNERSNVIRRGANPTGRIGDGVPSDH